MFAYCGKHLEWFSKFQIKFLWETLMSLGRHCQIWQTQEICTGQNSIWITRVYLEDAWAIIRNYASIILHGAFRWGQQAWSLKTGESYLTSRVCPMKGVAAYNLDILMCFSVSQALNWLGLLLFLRCHEEWNPSHSFHIVHRWCQNPPTFNSVANTSGDSLPQSPLSPVLNLSFRAINDFRSPTFWKIFSVFGPFCLIRRINSCGKEKGKLIKGHFISTSPEQKLAPVKKSMWTNTAGAEVREENLFQCL